MCDNKNNSKKKKKYSGNLYGNATSGGTFSLGWKRDHPDVRDHTPVNLRKSVKQKIRDYSFGPTKKGISMMLESTTVLPDSVDLHQNQYFTPIEDQREIGSCTANAVIGLVEYLIKAKSQKDKDFSRLFLYKVTRSLMAEDGVGDSGAYIRETIKALRLFGVPPQKWWPYIAEDFDDEPDAFVYAMSQSFQGLEYLRLDYLGIHRDTLLSDIKACLADGFPIAFGFYVTKQVFDVSMDDNTILFPKQNDKIEGGHAVVAAGYDDSKQALLIRNSWGTDWGAQGYGWLPYEYITSGLAFDFWTLFETEWLELDQFN
jgi:C1A family cysteine protease